MKEVNGFDILIVEYLDFLFAMYKFQLKVFALEKQFPSGNIELRRDARGTPSALSSSESYV